ncbi:MAG TPA: ATP-grasp domain-containing protein [Gemmatimonadaceae bacterium]
MRVLVLDGNENQAVAAVRSLAAAGHEVHVAAETSWSKAGWSRFARSQTRYTAPQRDAGAFIADLVQAIARHPGTLVLPMTERTTLPISAERQVLSAAHARLVLPDHVTVLRAFDKSATTRLAESLGIAVPQTAVLCDGPNDESRALANRLAYPVVLKAATSEEIDRQQRVRATGAPVYARSAEEFTAAYSQISQRATRVLVQEFVSGAGAGYFALAAHGRVRAEFAHRRIRDVRPTGSGSAVRESAPLDARLAAAGRQMLEALAWHGPAMVEFRVRRDGSPVFLEVNGRFWTSLALAIHAGVDFPRLVAELAEVGDVAPVASYRTGVRCRWFLGDARHLLGVMRGRPRGYDGAFPSRLGTLRDVLLPVPGTKHDLWRWDDPAPELGDWLHFIFRRVPKHLSRR